MKITFDIDCTPEEARNFFGLPDVKPMQDAMMQEVQDRMMSNLHAMEPETMFKTWLPAQAQGLEQLQKMFWSQLGKATQGLDTQSKTTQSKATQGSAAKSKR